MTEVRTGRLIEPTTFVFTDVVGSTKLWAADPEATGRSFLIHDTIVRTALKNNNGEIFGWAGDSFRAAFQDRYDAVAACQAIHRDLANADWEGDPALSVRTGVTYGRALHRDGEYFGPTLNTAARLEEMARPGQTVLSASAVAGLDGVTITALGRQRVRDIADAIELFQLGDQRFAPLRTVDPSLSTVPPLTGTLVGRSVEIADALAGLDGRHPVVIVGTGGAGKTRLAVEVAHLEMRNHPDGCYFVDLAPVTSGASAGAAIARSCRIKLSSDNAVQEIADHFADRHALLILDNCEHMVEYTAAFVKLLSVEAPGLRLLATSRERLGIAGECLIKLGPLETGADGAVVDLFVQRIQDQAPGFEPTTVELAQIAQVCEHLDGIPLALELAAARAGVLGLSHLLDGMHDRFRMLSSGRGDGTRTLREAIDWSFGLLSDQEQEFFTRCGVFMGSFDLRAAAAVVPDLDPLDVADLLHSLSRKSLIVAEGALGGRFRLLETIRAYAGLRLGEFGLEESIGQLHFEHYRDLVSIDFFAEAGDLDRAVRLAPEWSNIAGALEWGADRGFWLDAAKLASGCLGLWEDAVPTVEGKRWVERILPQIDQGRLEAHMLRYGLSAFEAQLDNFAEVNNLLGKIRESPVPELRAYALALTGYLAARVTPEASEPMFAAAEQLVIDHDLGHDTAITTIWARGAHAIYGQNLDEAYRCFRSGFDLAQEAPQRTVNTIFAGLSLATVQLLLERPSEALATLDSHNWADSRWDSSPILRAVALIDLDRASEATELVFAYATESLLGRMHRMSNDAMLGFAALALHRGENEHAWTLMQQAVTPRTPFTIGLVEGLADRIGRGDELRALHRQRTASLADLDAMVHVQAELDRMGAAIKGRVEA
jgi:predicted ATPase/class 3 adenylate cyclase